MSLSNISRVTHRLVSHMNMPNVTNVISITNDPCIKPSPTPLPNAKCQWATNPKSIPTPITQPEVYMINMTVCLLWVTKLFISHHGSLTPMLWNFLDHTARVSYTHVLGFSPDGVNGPLFAPPNTHYISLYALNCESFIRRHPKYEHTTHSSTLMMDSHTHAHTPNMLMSLCICNANVTANSHVTCMIHTR